MRDSLENEWVGSYLGVEPTPLNRPSSSPVPSATDPQDGFGTDSGLAGGLGPPVVPLAGTPLVTRPDRPSTIMPDTIMGSLATTSGLGSAVLGSTQ
jgi:hypothetical protein